MTITIDARDNQSNGLQQQQQRLWKVGDDRQTMIRSRATNPFSWNSLARRRRRRVVLVFYFSIIFIIIHYCALVLILCTDGLNSLAWVVMAALLQTIIESE